MINGPRRQLLSWLVASIAVLPLLPQLLYADVDSNNAMSTIPEDEKAKFMALSALLTGVTTLDENSGLKIMHKLQQEPWGEEHLHRVFQKFSIGKTEQPSTINGFENLDEGERWFVGHILTTWITGIYFHESGNEVMTYSHALMHSSLRDIYPEPHMCDSPFGYWQKPPTLL
ncbi:MAG: sugar dehydrogenase complex small subunit [Mariprofundaceae bacterium]|nr:sugar dehydrogenase complex small subunit [Mariprofundaceae bacterium]